jgi:tetratricopeptide (TPR) repeat protein
VASEVAELQARLARYPADRYPAQHATAQFHLGSALLHAGDVDPALAALATAEHVFAELGMRTEHAKSLMVHGAGLRAVGRHDEAVDRFTTAAKSFTDLGQRVEAAAAQHNLGLVLADVGDLDRARPVLATARELFHDADRPSWAGAAARELGTVLLHRGDPATAVPLLEESVDLIGEADPAGTGAAANVLGLAHLALGNAAAAVDAFGRALAWHPRSVRPAEHAMVKANLALAHEAAGDRAQARLTARHALGVPEAAEPVRSLAHGVLDRLPAATGSDLFTVLDREPAERWPTWVRDELLCWIDEEPATRVGDAAVWVREQVARGVDGADPAEVLLGALLELPPPAYDAVVGALVQATAEAEPADTERFLAVTRSAMARYPLPQWQRMAATFTAAAQRAGVDQQW